MIDYFIIFVFIMLLISSSDDGQFVPVCFKNTPSLRGIMALFIIFHHLSQNIAEDSLLKLFANAGYLVVAVFFFLSGYGLMSKVLQMGKEYLKGFWTKRIVKILIPCFTLSIIYFIYNIVCMGLGEAFRLIKINVLVGGLIANGWYVTAILYFYILFYFSFRFVKKDTYGLVILFFGSILYIKGCLILELGEWWYNSCLAFAVGAIYKKNELYLKNVSGRAAKWFIMVLFFLFIFAKRMTMLLETGDLSFLFTILSSTVFAVFSICIIEKKEIDNVFFDFLGKISFEFYMTQGVFIGLYRSDIIYIEDNFIYFLVAILSTLLMSYVVNIINNCLYSVFHKYSLHV